MKVCPKCGQEHNGNQSYCAACHCEYQKQWYKDNPSSIRDSSLRQKLVIRNFIKAQKDKPCADCGKSYPWYVMDFDHVRGEKSFELAEAASKYRSIEVVANEVAKCDVVCANCHRERTFNRKQWPAGGTADTVVLRGTLNPAIKVRILAPQPSSQIREWRNRQTRRT